MGGRFRGVFSDPGLVRLRESAVTMAATLLSFGCVLALKHAVGLTSSSVLLAVVLSLSLNRQRADRRPQPARMLMVAPVLLPLLAVGAGEIGTRMFTHPNLGDALFVAGMAGAIWLRRFGDIGRRAGTLVSLTLTATLITPGPVVPVGAGTPTRWWGAVVALIALAWVRLTWWASERVGVLTAKPAEVTPAAVPPRPVEPGTPWHRRLSAISKLALQMAVALAAAFAAGREVFGIHWTWTVLTAFIVSSGNRGRGDVAHKAVLRVAGAAGGTMIATVFANVFPAHDDWSVVTIFAVLAIAQWLRPVSYAFWAAGMTAALALLYGFYGEQGTHLLLDRLEGILLGAGIAVAVAWVVLPIRNVDVIRRQLAVALGAIAGQVSAGPTDVVFPPEIVALIRESTRSAELAGGSVHSLRWLPARWRSALPYAQASRELARGAAGLVAKPAVSAESREQLSSDLTAARRALAADAGIDQVADLPAVATRIAAVLGN